MKIKYGLRRDADTTTIQPWVAFVEDTVSARGGSPAEAVGNLVSVLDRLGGFGVELVHVAPPSRKRKKPAYAITSVSARAEPSASS